LWVVKGVGTLARAKSRKNRVYRIEVSLEVGSFKDLFGRIERIRGTDKQIDRMNCKGTIAIAQIDSIDRQTDKQTNTTCKGTIAIA